MIACVLSLQRACIYFDALILVFNGLDCNYNICIFPFFRFLTYDPSRRITAEKALDHEYFSVSNICW